MRRTTAVLAVAFAIAAMPAFAQNLPVMAVLELGIKDLDRADMRLFIDSLAGALFRTGMADVVDRESRDAVLEEIEFSASAAADAAQLSVGRQLAATHIVSGSLGRYGNVCVASLRITETATARVVGSVEELFPDSAALLSSTDRLAAALVRSAGFARAAPLATDVGAGPDAADPLEALLAAAAPSWTAFQFAIWAPLQLFPVGAGVRGLRLGLAFSANADLAGLDIGVVNTLAGRMVGLQLGIVNAVGGSRGVQSGLVGLAERAEILQANIFYNQAGALLGVQLGLVNVGDKCVGAQIGLVNIAGLLRGVQLGLVNVVRYGERAGFMPLVNLRL